MTRQAVHSRVHAYITMHVAYMYFRTTYESSLWRLHCNNVEVWDLSRLSDRNITNTDIVLISLRISHVEFDFRARSNWERTGMVECNLIFPVILLFRNLRSTSRGTTKISDWNSIRDCSIRSPTLDFRNIWPNEKRAITPYRRISKKKLAINEFYDIKG